MTTKIILLSLLTALQITAHGQFSMSGYFNTSKELTKKKLASSETTVLMKESPTTLMYMLDAEKDEKGMLASDKMMLLSFNNNKCDKVTLVLKKEEMNTFIELFNESFVENGEYHWTDYGGETKWELVRLENTKTDLGGQVASWRDFFSLVATPLRK